MTKFDIDRCIKTLYKWDMLISFIAPREQFAQEIHNEHAEMIEFIMNLVGHDAGLQIENARLKEQVAAMTQGEKV